MKKRILVVGMVLALLSVLAVPMAVFAADDSDTTTVAGNLSSGTIDTTITGSISGWNLGLDSNENTTSIDMNVKCNTGTWNVQVLEVVDGFNAADGKMAEYTGSAYVDGGEVMETAIQVKSSVTDSYVDLSGTAQTIETGDATPTGGNDYDIGIQQTVNIGDLMLETNVYRITITFESNLPA